MTIKFCYNNIIYYYCTVTINEKNDERFSLINRGLSVQQDVREISLSEVTCK